MKVVHVIKKIEEIDQDIKELKKLEKSINRNKSFSTPIYMSIEKQINIMLGERIKLFELKIENPPDYMTKEIEDKSVIEKPILPSKSISKNDKKPKSKKIADKADEIDIDDIPMLTQDQIDARFDSIKDRDISQKKSAQQRQDSEKSIADDKSVKILDIALEKGSLSKEDEEKKDKDKKVKFFRDNFPMD